MGKKYQTSVQIEEEIKKLKKELTSSFEASTPSRETTTLERCILETHYLLDSSLMIILYISL